MCAGGVRLVILAFSRVFFRLRVASVSPFFFSFLKNPPVVFFFFFFFGVSTFQDNDTGVF